MVVVIDKGLRHVLEFLDFYSREGPAMGMHGNLMENLVVWSQKKGLSW